MIRLIYLQIRDAKDFPPGNILETQKCFKLLGKDFFTYRMKADRLSYITIISLNDCNNGLKTPEFKKREQQHKNAILFWMEWLVVLLIVLAINSFIFLPFYHYLIFWGFSSQQSRQELPSRIELWRFLALTIANKIQIPKRVKVDWKQNSKCVGAFSNLKLNVSPGMRPGPY